MSQRKLKNKKYELVYGEDHIDGLFVQVFDGEEMVISYSQADDPWLNIEKVVEIAEEFGFNLSDEVMEGVIV